MWLVNGALLAAIVGGGGAIQAADGELFSRGEQFSQHRGTVVPLHAGYLRFVVDPWAEVLIDGQHVLTTPSARRVALRPGRHWLKFRNRFYPEVNREVHVVAGETQTIEVVLEDAEDVVIDDGDAPPEPEGAEP